MSTLLLADGDPGVRTTLARSLAGYGFAVVATASGQEAISVLRSRDVDVLITELSLPVVDGFGLLAHVKHHAANLPTVVLTALDPATYRERLAEFGSPRVLRKPVSVKAVADEAKSVLSEVVRGSVAGITLPSLLQMLEWERKTCSVRVASPEGSGRLDFLAGKLVNAFSYTTRAEGTAAAYEIFVWDDADLRLERLHSSAERYKGSVAAPLQPLLLDAMRRKDERARRSLAEPADEDAVLVGETEDDVFFRRNRQRGAPAPPQPAPPQPVPEAVAAPTVAVAAAPAGQAARAAPSTATRPEPQPEPRLEPAPPSAPERQLPAAVTETLQGLVDGTGGALAAMLVDYRSGAVLGRVGGGLNLEVAATGNSRVVRAKMKTMANLALGEDLEDILITLSSQYHLLRVLPSQELFAYLVLEKKANLAMARYRLKALADLLGA